MEKLSIINKNMHFIDLFSGAGGFSLGFFLAGFKDLLAIELDKVCSKTYSTNFPSCKMIIKDIRKIHSLDLTIKPDIVLASPPCEPFTSANPRRKKSIWDRFYEDKNGDLIFHAIRVIGDLQPEFFIIENVIPMIEGDAKNLLKEEFRAVGYPKIFFNILSSENYGCPSTRNRVFISNTHLKPKKRKKIVVKDALLDMVSPRLPNNLPNHSFVHLSKQVKKKVYKLKPGQAAVYFKGSTGEKSNWERLDENQIAPTVMGKSRFVHPTENRALTPREHARLMGFPDEFLFTGNIYEVYNQIGESVPPPLAKAIAKKIKEKKSN